MLFNKNCLLAAILAGAILLPCGTAAIAKSSSHENILLADRDRNDHGRKDWSKSRDRKFGEHRKNDGYRDDHRKFDDHKGKRPGGEDFNRGKGPRDHMQGNRPPRPGKDVMPGQGMHRPGSMPGQGMRNPIGGPGSNMQHPGGPNFPGQHGNFGGPAGHPNGMPPKGFPGGKPGTFPQGMHPGAR